MAKIYSRLHTFIPSPVPSPPEITLIPRPSWVRLNIYVLALDSTAQHIIMHKWGLVPSANCSCGAEKKTADHTLASCLLYYHPNGILDLAALDEDTVDWLQTTADDLIIR